MTTFSYPATDVLYQPCSQDSQPQLDDAHELMLRIKAGDSDARQRLITGNLRHVLHSNRRYASSRAGIFDLLEAGNLGLVHALDNFEAEGDGSFSEYAALCIRQHIERTLNLGNARQGIKLRVLTDTVAGSVGITLSRN